MLVAEGTSAFWGTEKFNNLAYKNPILILFFFGHYLHINF